MITQERLKYLFDYNPESGIFTRLITLGSSAIAGHIAGSKSDAGYLMIRIDGRLYRSHRLAFLYMDGEFPFDHTDHINGIRHDNRWVNLRAVTEHENHKNQKKRMNTKSGIMGIGWCKQESKWRASIVHNYKYKCLGRHRFIVLAVIARKKAEIEFGFHINHGAER